MKVLIKIKTDSELISYEAAALGLLLASFDYHIQLCFDDVSCLTNPTTRIYGMVQSLALYDLPKAWIGEDYDKLNSVIQAVTEQKLVNEADFDSILCF